MVSSVTDNDDNGDETLFRQNSKTNKVLLADANQNFSEGHRRVNGHKIILENNVSVKLKISLLS